MRTEPSAGRWSQGPLVQRPKCKSWSQLAASSRPGYILMVARVGSRSHVNLTLFIDRSSLFDNRACLPVYYYCPTWNAWPINKVTCLVQPSFYSQLLPIIPKPCLFVNIGGGQRVCMVSRLPSLFLTYTGTVSPLPSPFISTKHIWKPKGDDGCHRQL